jgi:hypothetical protein
VRARKGIALVAALAGLLVGAESAAACTCVPVQFERQLKRADGAFNGRLLSITPVEGTSDARYRYRVGVVVKGSFRRGQVVTVWSLYGDAMCGLMTGVGEVYGLFVDRKEERWTSSLCATISAKRMRRAADAEGASSGSAPTKAPC